MAAGRPPYARWREAADQPGSRSAGHAAARRAALEDVQKVLTGPAIGQTGTFITYAAVTALSLVYVLAKVPETKGLKLSEIEAELSPDPQPAKAA